MSLIPRSHHPDGWAVVHVSYSMPEAHIVVGRLETEGIRSWIYQEAVGSAIGITIGPLGEVKVLVAPEDYERARAILDEDVDDADALDLSDADDLS